MKHPSLSTYTTKKIENAADEPAHTPVAIPLLADRVNRA